MNKRTAVNKLKANRTINTSMLSALDITFEQWLKVAQYNEKSFQICIDRLIAREEKKLNKLTQG
jgi:hypothetical protein